ncbi:MAG: cupredoxin domain-containing protein [Nanoarchaeota archaeon]|nr:cupredoxin domain-containing protein [Nanoarchaeota archaeon]
MEQKQLDELEDSFFGEEFIEDLEDLPPAHSKGQEIKEIKIEPREQASELRLQKMQKKASSPLVKKSVAKKSEKSAVVKTKEAALEERYVAVEKAAEAKEQLKDKKSYETSAKKETAPKKEMVTVNIKPAKESVKETMKETKSTVETSSPVNPWEDDEKSSSLFKETSTWKALTGIALVLLVLSLFTQGFNFSEKDTLTGAATVGLPEAEQKVLEYVNTQLLEFPFQAEVQSSEELDALYKVTLAVAGQTVDSYLTKDGTLFFPQGLDMNEGVLDNEVEANSKELEVAKELEVEVKAETEPAPSEPELAPENPEEPQEVEELPAESATGETTKLTLNAKKWVFQPNVLRVKKGSTVVLTVVPAGLDFTFAVPSLGVETEVVGTTEVVFTADKAGTFDFTCGSCEDWRGMRGNLVVESSK